jgi:hypothetical protein
VELHECLRLAGAVAILPLVRDSGVTQEELGQFGKTSSEKPASERTSLDRMAAHPRRASTQSIVFAV